MERVIYIVLCDGLVDGEGNLNERIDGEGNQNEGVELGTRPSGPSPYYIFSLS
jgi:hypothetical protein